VAGGLLREGGGGRFGGSWGLGTFASVLGMADGEMTGGVAGFTSFRRGGQASRFNALVANSMLLRVCNISNPSSTRAKDRTFTHNSTHEIIHQLGASHHTLKPKHITSPQPPPSQSA